MTDKERYREFCEKEKNIPIFSKDWWLDCVCREDNWDVVLVKKGGQIVGSMPYVISKRLIFDVITMPSLTQTMGPYIKYPKGQKHYKKLSWEKEVFNELLSNLPDFDYFSQNFYRTITNWLPFYWAGYSQSTGYTYVVENTSLEELERNFETDIRRRRRKACESGMYVLQSDDIETFYDLNTKTFARQGKNIPYGYEFVKQLFFTCKDYNAVKMFFAFYEDKAIAANFLVYDKNTVYYLMGGIDPKYKDLGGMDIVQYESIKFALEDGRTFDFEGSMIESIEKYFRSFGAVQKPYFHITKTNSKLLKTLRFAKGLFR